MNVHYQSTNRIQRMNTKSIRSSADAPRRLSVLLAVVSLALWSTTTSQAVPITSPGAFTVPMTVIDYSHSPVGLLPGSTSITTQYATLGVIHDGSTTTPPGPPGMSSFSGLPALESPAGDPDGHLPITIDFTVPVTEVGAFYLMGSSTDAIMLTAFRADHSVIESVTILPSSMPLHPGPFGYNEGFVGLITGEAISSVVFAPSTSAFVIDDLHFGAGPVPDAGTTLAFLGLSLVGLFGASRTRCFAC